MEGGTLAVMLERCSNQSGYVICVCGVCCPEVCGLGHLFTQEMAAALPGLTARELRVQFPLRVWKTQLKAIFSPSKHDFPSSSALLRAVNSQQGDGTLRNTPEMKKKLSTVFQAEARQYRSLKGKARSKFLARRTVGMKIALQQFAANDEARDREISKLRAELKLCKGSTPRKRVKENMSTRTHLRRRQDISRKVEKLEQDLEKLGTTITGKLEFSLPPSREKKRKRVNEIFEREFTGRYAQLRGSVLAAWLITALPLRFRVSQGEASPPETAPRSRGALAFRQV